MTSLTGVHHIAIICSDYSRSREFYTGILRLAVIRESYRSDRHSWKLDLDAGNGVQIELFSFPAPPSRPTNPEACGLRHLAFATDDITASIEHLTKNGINCDPVRIDEYTGKRFCFFRDPDGLPLELYETVP